MSKEERNRSIVEHMVSYCERVASDRRRCGDSLDALLADDLYQRGCAMAILQIGELSTHLTEEFKQRHGNIPWRAVKDMRNIVAHEYDAINFTDFWKTMTVDVPALQSACEVILDGLHD